MMKKTNVLVAPLFASVVLLLSVGAIGELFVSLFTKSKETLTNKETTTEGSLETATQQH
jgi:hypothetical protein